MPTEVFTREVRLTANLLRLIGSVVTFLTPDGRVAAAGGGWVGYGPTREAALRDLARCVEEGEAARRVGASARSGG
jgi:hypothetical protein